MHDTRDEARFSATTSHCEQIREQFITTQATIVYFQNHNVRNAANINLHILVDMKRFIPDLLGKTAETNGHVNSYRKFH